MEKVIFKKLSHKGENKRGQLTATLELWEYIPQTITQVQLQFRLRQVRRRRGEQSEGRLQELPEQRTGQVPRTG